MPDVNSEEQTLLSSKENNPSIASHDAEANADEQPHVATETAAEEKKPEEKLPRKMKKDPRDVSIPFSTRNLTSIRSGSVPIAVKGYKPEADQASLSSYNAEFNAGEQPQISPESSSPRYFLSDEQIRKSLISALKYCQVELEKKSITYCLMSCISCMFFSDRRKIATIESLDDVIMACEDEPDWSLQWFMESIKSDKTYASKYCKAVLLAFTAEGPRDPYNQLLFDENPLARDLLANLAVLKARLNEDGKDEPSPRQARLITDLMDFIKTTPFSAPGAFLAAIKEKVNNYEKRRHCHFKRLNAVMEYVQPTHSRKLVLNSVTPPRC